MIETLDISKLKGLTQDSRGVKTGYLFAALQGAKADGTSFIADAIRNGASAVLAGKGVKLPGEAKNVALITEENPRAAFAKLAARFYKNQPAHIIAVTGTNGKTSTVDFVKQLWKSKNIKAASIGTLGMRAPGMVRSGSMTTPDPVSLHAELADLASAGVTHLAMEASSHGLHQHRLDGVKINVAGFTNLTRDHLDYHSDMDHYFESKIRLFSEVMQKGTAVLNADALEFEKLKTICKKRSHRVIAYGRNGEDIKILDASPAPHGQNLHITVFGKDYNLKLPLVGGFQVMNALCALGIVLAENDNDPYLYVKALEKLQGVPGRLQLVSGNIKTDAAVYIDYAHTPDALETILTALRPHTRGKLVCLFGCGGNRDAGKRPMMGEIATRLADQIIITDDNPRTEDPAIIRAAILKSAPLALEIAGRREAIQAAISNLNTGDVLVIAGKGHEHGQVFADHTEPFDDYDEAFKAMRKLSS